jgi:hypothetical protein
MLASSGQKRKSSVGIVVLVWGEGEGNGTGALSKPIGVKQSLRALTL